MIDIDKLEALAKDAAQTGMAGHRIKFFMTVDPESVLALITEVRRMRTLLDSRPALNAGLVEAYTQWTAGVYESDGSAVGKEMQQ